MLNSALCKVSSDVMKYPINTLHHITRSKKIKIFFSIIYIKGKKSKNGYHVITYIFDLHFFTYLVHYYIGYVDFDKGMTLTPKHVSRLKKVLCL